VFHVFPGCIVDFCSHVHPLRSILPHSLLPDRQGMSQMRGKETIPDHVRDPLREPFKVGAHAGGTRLGLRSDGIQSGNIQGSFLVRDVYVILESLHVAL